MSKEVERVSCSEMLTYVNRSDTELRDHLSMAHAGPSLVETVINVFRSGQKAMFFVQHIQDHLNKYEVFPESLKEGRFLPAGKVGCKICNRTVDQIWSGRGL